MTIANVSRANVLPSGLRSAQEAVQLPEVQAMLRRLSEFNLGIFMPHIHDEHSGDFQPLPDELLQVESGLAVSFLPTVDIEHQTDRFVPVGWVWRAGTSKPAAVCEMGPNDTGAYGKHKMRDGT